MARPTRPTGHATRGTTNTNRLRRVDRWIGAHPVLRTASRPLVVDLGFGASGVTAFELATRLRRVRPDVEVLGLEIDQERVDRATAQLEEIRDGRTDFAPDLAVRFARGGFETPVPRPALFIRASNVLRQYEEAAVPGAWQAMCRQLTSDGMLIDGTCDEIGRVSAWIDVNANAQPRHLTLSLRLDDLVVPSIVAERLPKALIHHNVPGERVHELMTGLDAAWARNAAVGTFSPRQRWNAAVDDLRTAGWPVRTPRSRVRLGELTLDWSAVAPRGPSFAVRLSRA